MHYVSDTTLVTKPHRRARFRAIRLTHCEKRITGPHSEAQDAVPQGFSGFDPPIGPADPGSGHTDAKPSPALGSPPVAEAALPPSLTSLASPSPELAVSPGLRSDTTSRSHPDCRFATPSLSLRLRGARRASTVCTHYPRSSKRIRAHRCLHTSCPNLEATRQCHSCHTPPRCGDLSTVPRGRTGDRPADEAVRAPSQPTSEPIWDRLCGCRA